MSNWLLATLSVRVCVLRINGSSKKVNLSLCWRRSHSKNRRKAKRLLLSFRNHIGFFSSLLGLTSLLVVSVSLAVDALLVLEDLVEEVLVLLSQLYGGSFLSREPGLSCQVVAESSMLDREVGEDLS